jgi:hypothetical protein
MIPRRPEVQRGLPAGRRAAAAGRDKTSGHVVMDRKIGDRHGFRSEPGGSSQAGRREIRASPHFPRVGCLPTRVGRRKNRDWLAFRSARQTTFDRRAVRNTCLSLLFRPTRGDCPELLSRPPARKRSLALARHGVAVRMQPGMVLKATVRTSWRPARPTIPPDWLWRQALPHCSESVSRSNRPCDSDGRPAGRGPVWRPRRAKGNGRRARIGCRSLFWPLVRPTGGRPGSPEVVLNSMASPD